MSFPVFALRAPHAAWLGHAAIPLAVSCLTGTALPALAEPATAAATPSVVVNATRFPEPAANLPFGVSVIDAEQIRSSGVGTVNEALMKLLGVPGRLDFYGGGDYALDLRGFGSTASSNQVVVVDGVRISEADLSNTRLAGIPIDAIERIEVVRGNAAVLYGEGATGGAIVITTKAASGTDRRNHADVYGAIGSHRTREARATATLAAGGFSLDASGNRRDSDNHRDNFHSKVDGESVTAQWRDAQLRIGGRYAQDGLDTRLPGSLTPAQLTANRRQSLTPNDHASIRNDNGGVFGEATFGGWQFAADAARRHKTLDSFTGFAYAYRVEADTYALRARNTARWGTVDNSFVAGFDRNDWQRVVKGSFGTTDTQTAHAVYLRDELALATGTRLTAGWRDEKIAKHSVGGSSSQLDGTQHAWELGVLQQVLSEAAVYARIARSYRLANVDEFTYTSGVPLRPQTSRDAELGARWAHGDSAAEVRAYRSHVTNEIGFDPNAANSFGGFNVNFDPTRRQGVELEFKQAIGADAHVGANAALRQARFRTGAYAGKDVPLVPKRTAAVHADWAPWAGQRFDAIINWVSPQHPDFQNQCALASYATVDVRYAVRFGVAEVALGVANLADRQYVTQSFGCNAATHQATALYPEAGRAYTLSVRAGF